MKDNQVTGDGQDACLATLVLFLAPLIGVGDERRHAAFALLAFSWCASATKCAVEATYQVKGDDLTLYSGIGGI